LTWETNIHKYGKSSASQLFAVRLRGQRDCSDGSENLKKLMAITLILFIEVLALKYLILDGVLLYADEPARTIFAVAMGMFVAFTDWIFVPKLFGNEERRSDGR
jgi:hypothetical protein